MSVLNLSVKLSYFFTTKLKKQFTPALHNTFSLHAKISRSDNFIPLGYISPLNAFLTGQNATLAFNNYSIAHCVHTILCLAIIILSYYYIKYYLRKNHSLATVNAESGGPSKSMFNFKALITASVIGSIALILFAFTQKQTQDFPFGVMLSSFILLGININLACQNNIKEYFFLQVKKFVLTSSLKVTNPLKKKKNSSNFARLEMRTLALWILRSMLDLDLLLICRLI